MKDPSVITIHQNQYCHDNCLFAKLCLLPSLLKGGRLTLRRPRFLNRGEHLFITGDAFDALYVMYSGSAKSYLLAKNGEQQIIGFHLPGDLIGIDGFDKNKHAYSLEFLEISRVCRISLTDLNKLLATSSESRNHLLKAMSHILVQEQHLLFSLGKLTADQRVAGFLLDLSTRFEYPKNSGCREFNLSMSRYDIANYLGLAVETVCRALTKFQRLGFIKVERRRIRILNIANLQICIDGDYDENQVFQCQQSI